MANSIRNILWFFLKTALVRALMQLSEQSSTGWVNFHQFCRADKVCTRKLASTGAFFDDMQTDTHGQIPRNLGTVTQDTRDEEETEILRAMFYFMEDLKKEIGLWPCVDCHGLWNSLGTDVLWALLSCYILRSHKSLNPSRQMAYNNFLLAKT